jgi:hypothetical protein
MDSLGNASAPGAQTAGVAEPTTEAQALLFVFMDPPEDEAAFHEWYNDEHAPNRLTVPGILNGRRYQAVEGGSPRYLAYYDMANEDVLKSAEYKRLVDERSDRERAVMATIPHMDRRVLRLTDGSPAWTDDAPYVMSVAMDPPADVVDDFHAWYREEHMPLLLKVPGWRRIRRFEQIEGTGPRFLALHELESLAVFETEEYRAATNTPWRDRIIPAISRRERNLFKLYRTFPRPAWGAP